jgi:hypothetical protein
MNEAYGANSGMIDNQLFGYSYCALVYDTDTLLRLRMTGCTIGFIGTIVFGENCKMGWDAV